MEAISHRLLPASVIPALSVNAPPWMSNPPLAKLTALTLVMVAAGLFTFVWKLVPAKFNAEPSTSGAFQFPESDQTLLSPPPVQVTWPKAIVPQPSSPTTAPRLRRCLSITTIPLSRCENPRCLTEASTRKVRYKRPKSEIPPRLYFIHNFVCDFCKRYGWGASGERIGKRGVLFDMQHCVKLGMLGQAHSGKCRFL